MPTHTVRKSSHWISQEKNCSTSSILNEGALAKQNSKFSVFMLKVISVYSDVFYPLHGQNVLRWQGPVK